MSDISQPGDGGTKQVWRRDAPGNNYSAPNGAKEGWLGADVNDVVREVMAAVRRWYQDPTWQWLLFDTPATGKDKTITVTPTDSNAFTISDSNEDVLKLFTEGRLIRLAGSAYDPETEIVGTYKDVFVDIREGGPGPVFGLSGETVTVTTRGADLGTGGSEFIIQDNGVALNIVRDAGSIGFAGRGTTAERDGALTTAPPTGAVWINTDTNNYDIGTKDGATSTWFALVGLTDDAGHLTIQSLADDDDTYFASAGDAIVTLASQETKSTTLLMTEEDEGGTPVNKARVLYDATGNRAVFEGGDWTSEGDPHFSARVSVQEEEVPGVSGSYATPAGGLFYQRSEDGVPDDSGRGREQSMVPYDIVLPELLHEGTGSLAEVSIVGGHFKFAWAYETTLPAKFQEITPLRAVDLSVQFPFSMETTGSVINNWKLRIDVIFGNAGSDEFSQTLESAHILNLPSDVAALGKTFHHYDNRYPYNIHREPIGYQDELSPLGPANAGINLDFPTIHDDPGSSATQQVGWPGGGTSMRPWVPPMGNRVAWGSYDPAGTSTPDVTGAPWDTMKILFITTSYQTTVTSQDTTIFVGETGATDEDGDPLPPVQPFIRVSWSGETVPAD